MPEVIFFYFCVHCRQWLAKKTKSSPPYYFKYQDAEVIVMMMMGAEGGVAWPLCHVPRCTCSTSWCYQGPLVSLAIHGKLPKNIG